MLTVPAEPVPNIVSEPAYVAPSPSALEAVPHNLIEEPIHFVEPWATRFGIEYGSDSDDLSRFGFDLLTHRSGGFGIDLGLRLYRESGADFRDHLWLGDANIVYELFPTEQFRTRVGIGLNWLADNYGAEAGLNLTLGADLFLMEQLVISADSDFGTLGDADLVHWRVTAGLIQAEHLEWFAGYDHLDIGGVKITGVIGGLRFRF